MLKDKIMMKTAIVLLFQLIVVIFHDKNDNARALAADTSIGHRRGLRSNNNDSNEDEETFVHVNVEIKGTGGGGGDDVDRGGVVAVDNDNEYKPDLTGIMKTRMDPSYEEFFATASSSSSSSSSGSMSATSVATRYEHMENKNTPAYIGPPPNIIFLFADDVGYGDITTYGHPYTKTPNLDKLASQGTQFHQFHNTGNVCPTSRAGFMTSRNPSWYPNFTQDYGFLNAITITQLLKEQAGYYVGHIGKWNIGPTPANGNAPETLNDPLRYGIDDIRIVGSIANDPRGKEGLRFDEVLDFLDTRALEENSKQPFYLNVWIYATHTPVDPPIELINEFNDLRQSGNFDRSVFGDYMQPVFNYIDDRTNYNEPDLGVITSMQKYLAEVYGMDQQIGRVLDKLDELGIADNTVVVFSSDNGPAKIDAGMNNVGWAGGLRGEKHSWYEGGTRVPFIVRWPGKVPAGYINRSSLMSSLDWLPTIASLAQIKDIPYSIIEGEDLSDIWLGKSSSTSTTINGVPIQYTRIGNGGGNGRGNAGGGSSTTTSGGGGDESGGGGNTGGVVDEDDEYSEGSRSVLPTTNGGERRRRRRQRRVVRTRHLKKTRKTTSTTGETATNVASDDAGGEVEGGTDVEEDNDNSKEVEEEEGVDDNGSKDFDEGKGDDTQDGKEKDQGDDVDEHDDTDDGDDTNIDNQDDASSTISGKDEEEDANDSPFEDDEDDGDDATEDADEEDDDIADEEDDTDLDADPSFSAPVIVDRSRKNPLYWRHLSIHTKASIRYGSWKLYIDKSEMYNIERDEQERHNLYHHEKYERVRDSLIENLQAWNSTLPTVNRRKSRNEEMYPYCPTAVIGPPKLF